MRTPSLVVHCDWSTSPTKRWMATATWEDRRYRLAAPPQVGSADALLRSLLQTRPSPVLIGFDFPIGLPLRYGDMTGFENFRHCLREFGRGDWAEWFDVVDDRRDLSIYRPFYPSRPGGRLQEHLLSALGASNINDLRRLCELPTSTHGPGCPLFWTLGGNQV